MTSGSDLKKKKKKKKQTKSADYPKNKTTQRRYDAFCMAYHTNGNNGADACVKSGYSKKTARQQAEKLLTLLYIKEKLAKLQEKASEEYTITLEQRLKWLEGVVKEGFAEHLDAQMNERPLGLNNVVSAVKELNLMLGTTTEEEAPELAITYSVNSPKSAVTVTNAKS